MKWLHILGFLLEMITLTLQSFSVINFGSMIDCDAWLQFDKFWRGSWSIMLSFLQEITLIMRLLSPWWIHSQNLYWKALGTKQN